MARSVGNDELPPGRREVAISNIDGDSLLAFGAQAIGEQRKVDLARRRSAFALDRTYLVFVD